MLQETSSSKSRRRDVTGKNAANPPPGRGPDPRPCCTAAPRRWVTSRSRCRARPSRRSQQGPPWQRDLQAPAQGHEGSAPRHDPRPHARPDHARDAARGLRPRPPRQEAPRQERRRGRRIAAGVKEGGILNIVTHEILIECLPDASGVDQDRRLRDEDPRSFRVSDLKAGDKIKVLENADRGSRTSACRRPRKSWPPSLAVPGAEGAVAATSPSPK